MATMFFTLALLFGLLTVSPFVVYPLSLWLLRPLLRAPLKPDLSAQPTRMAICICAYNEEAVIRQKAENLLALRHSMPDLQILIYVDAASDQTASILQDYADSFDITTAPERHGKTYGMNLLVAKATAPIIVFTDANVLLAQDALTKLAPYFADPSVGCVCGSLSYVNGTDGVTAATGSAYWRLEEYIKQLESDTGSVIGADGSIFAIRRALHQPPPNDIIDDMFVSLCILCDGHRVVRAADVRAYEKSVSSSPEEFRRKIRIACQAFNVHRLLWPRLQKLDALNIYKYIMHKFLRWFTALWIVLGSIFFYISLFAAGMGEIALLLAIATPFGLIIGAQHQIKPFPQIYDILSAFFGTGLGVLQSMCGEHYQTWNPAVSIRETKS
jgi:glycosyltransferase involved in cell wall biosynthesis